MPEEWDENIAPTEEAAEGASTETTLPITLPATLARFAKERAARTHRGDVAAFLRDLLERERSAEGQVVVQTYRRLSDLLTAAEVAPRHERAEKDWERLQATVLMRLDPAYIAADSAPGSEEIPTP